MGSKRQYPPPLLPEAFAWIDRPLHPRVFCRVVIHPHAHRGDMYVSTELGLRTLAGGEIVCRRYGERIRIGGIDLLMGALFRACMQAGLWLDEKDSEEVFRLFLWETGQQ